MAHMGDHTKEYWHKFFIDAGITDDYASEYASIFVKHRIQQSRLSGINDTRLEKMGITVVGDCIAIVEYVKKIKEKKKVVVTAAGSSENFWSTREDDMNVHNKYLRRDFYFGWANLEDVGIRFAEIVHLMKNFFKDHVIVVHINSTEYEGDILFSFIGKVNPRSQFSEFEALNIRPSDVKIFDPCLNQPIIISEDILKGCKRHTACSNVKAIGYLDKIRHIIAKPLLNMEVQTKMILS